MVVRSQNRVLSRNFDPVAIMDHIFRKGFSYHHKFIRPGFMRGLYQKIIRRMAGLGDLPSGDVKAEPTERRRTDVLIIGSELSALAAAAICAESGLRTVIVRQKTLSSVITAQSVQTFDHRLGSNPEIQAIIDRAEKAISRSPKVVDLQNAISFGAFDGGIIGAASPSQMHIIEPKYVILAEGWREQPIRFFNWDLPGILQESAAMRLMHSFGIPPGRRLVVTGVPERTMLLADYIRKQDIEMAAIVMEGADQEAYEAWMHDLLRIGWRITTARGGKAVRGAVIVNGGKKERITCDCIITCGSLEPRVELARQLGCLLSYEDDSSPRIVVDERCETSRRGIFAIGSSAGISDPLKAVHSGEVVGRIIVGRHRGMGE